ncbi:alpha-mannosyltransferase [Pacificimonas flava]|uniref:Alpha-mannosyltransferase n=2 Tax=Pacificimonas TaxID=1960290 RepID=A0A219B5N7_9SPHN|nr:MULTISPECIES: glycosyltransferase family 1 protein [Pacificimonas]MBZ6377190.1 glycosyltransferase family 1 protein [Pacificimonas aurantium]OWV33088.1 alpha-mannosyltransferase [Pacificimonas flava]
MRITIVTDAWIPQVNGVVRTLQTVKSELEAMGDTVDVISPDLFPSFPCPSYPEIRLSIAWSGQLGRRFRRFVPDAIHIATEGPLGMAARRWCTRKTLPFTTAYHTQFPDYVSARTGVPAALLWRFERWFHRPAAATLAATPSLRTQLAEQGIGPLLPFGRGVDFSAFPETPPPRPAAYDGLRGPIQLYVGRVAVEKNLEAFLRTSQPGTKIIVGDGPARAALARTYPDAVFLGALHGADLAAAYAHADVFVFPSRTDTFGLVIIEALACGTPVAAYPVQGPIDLVAPHVGALSEDLDAAIREALTRDRAACKTYGRGFTWASAAQEFRSALARFTTSERQEAFALDPVAA